MKVITCLLFCAFIGLVSCQTQRDDEKVGEKMNLPLTYVEGLGPFHPSASLLGYENPKDTIDKGFWAKTYLPVRGVPKTWKLVKKSMVWLDVHQLIYQNFQAGTLNDKEFAGFKKSSEWEPDPNELPDKPIKCFVYVIRGRDEKGNAAVMVDTDNDLDFSDEIPFYPAVAYKNNLESIETYQEAEKKYFTYEVYEGGKLVNKRIPIMIKRMPFEPAGMDFLYYFPIHARTQIKIGGEKYEIAIAGGSRIPTFEHASFVLLEKDSTKKYEHPEFIKKGDLLTLGSILNKVQYRNEGVSLYHNALQFSTVNPDEREYSLKAGYPFRPFDVKEFQTENSISMRDYKGRYLFIDFWGTWCKPCVQELPELQRIYKGIDKSKVAFVSIAGNDTPASLSRFLKKRPLDWPQILSDSTNKLIKTYNVSSFPTTVLVGTVGKVVAKDLHGAALEQKLAKLEVLVSH
ncbi:TlpA family protein disulfide reductase [Salmonirosea aquatica]|uniref:Redoxin domain-containing protein n=1 Tax=Salmonirosea aquatica TaxID=2654236 RepID=A0A7C9BEU9_9BACT|nr:redoxin domain-containing protein [Cytophagaceae bacterium SJW1-29]